MIEIYVKSKVIYHKPVVAMILKSNRTRWLKTKILDVGGCKKEMASLGVIIALKHIIDKFRRKPIAVYVDSKYLLEMMSRNPNGEYKHKNSSVKMTKLLRSVIDREFPKLDFRAMPNNDDYKELQQVYVECGADGIELDEKE